MCPLPARVSMASRSTASHSHSTLPGPRATRSNSATGRHGRDRLAGIEQRRGGPARLVDAKPAADVITHLLGHQAVRGKGAAAQREELLDSFFAVVDDAVPPR